MLRATMLSVALVVVGVLTAHAQQQPAAPRYYPDDGNGDRITILDRFRNSVFGEPASPPPKPKPKPKATTTSQAPNKISGQAPSKTTNQAPQQPQYRTASAGQPKRSTTATASAPAVRKAAQRPVQQKPVAEEVAELPVDTQGGSGRPACPAGRRFA